MRAPPELFLKCMYDAHPTAPTAIPQTPAGNSGACFYCVKMCDCFRFSCQTEQILGVAKFIVETYNPYNVGHSEVWSKRDSGVMVEAPPGQCQCCDA